MADGTRNRGRSTCGPQTKPCSVQGCENHAEGLQCGLPSCARWKRDKTLVAASREQVKQEVAALDAAHDSKWETEYHAHLKSLKAAGAIRDYRWKDFRVRLVRQDGERDRYYSPEALVWANDGAVEVHEIKGQKREAGMMRFDLARAQWPCFRWRMLEKRRGEWVQIRGDRGRD